MTAKRNIGGSLLPSSCPHILKPIVCGAGTLQVRAVPDLDTHMLFLRHDRGETQLAEHPNGYSCHVLAEAVASGDVARSIAQAEYIQACGGMTRCHKAIAFYALEAQA